MKKSLLLVILFMLAPLSSFANENGVISVKSDFNVKQTIQRFEKILKSKGVTIFAKVNHSKGGKKVNLPIRDTQLIIFGNPKLGTHLMMSNQLAGLDLPLKALAWQDEKGDVWLSYNNPSYLSKRHHLDGTQKVINKISSILKKLTAKATKNN